MAQADGVAELERGRGRQAEAPTQIPAKGWKDILFRTFKEVGNDRVTLVAAGVTYFLLLALFPAVTASFSIYGLVVDPATVREHVAVMTGFVPQGGIAIIEDQLSRLVEQGTPTLGFALAISLGLALWSTSAGVKALFEAMNIAYDEDEKRNFFQLNALALLFTLAGVIGAVVMLATVVALPAVLGLLGLSSFTEWLAQIGAYVLLTAVLVVGLAALYRFGPSRHQARWRWITPGAILAVVVIIAASALFSWYAANLGNYEQTYGSLGGLIGFLFWVWVCVNVVIVGAELNSEIEHQTARDSTIGADAPMGSRGAMMADTVGARAGTKAAEGDDDGIAAPDGHSEDWQAGYLAGRRAHLQPARGKPLPLAAAIPVAAAMTLLGRRAKARAEDRSGS